MLISEHLLCPHLQGMSACKVCVCVRKRETNFCKLTGWWNSVISDIFSCPRFPKRGKYLAVTQTQTSVSRKHNCNIWVVSKPSNKNCKQVASISPYTFSFNVTQNGLRKSGYTSHLIYRKLKLKWKHFLKTRACGLNLYITEESDILYNKPTIHWAFAAADLAPCFCFSTECKCSHPTENKT